MAATARAVAPRRASAHSRARAPAPPSSARTRSTAAVSSSALPISTIAWADAKLVRDGLKILHVRTDDHGFAEECRLQNIVSRREPPACRP